MCSSIAAASYAPATYYCLEHKLALHTVGQAWQRVTKVG